MSTIFGVLNNSKVYIYFSFGLSDHTVKLHIKEYLHKISSIREILLRYQNCSHENKKNGHNVTTATCMTFAIDEGVCIADCQVAVVNIETTISDLNKVERNWICVNC